MTFESMRHDAFAAIDMLQTWTEASRLVAIGCRLGGLIAASVVSDTPSVPLALWDPVLEPDAYFREALRALRVAEMTALTSSSWSRAKRIDDLADHDWVDVHGYPLFGSFIRSFRRRSLSGDIGPHARPVLLLNAGATTDSVGRTHASLIRELTDTGCSVDIVPMGSQVGWWFRGGAHERDQIHRLTPRVVTAMTDWIGTQLDQSGSAC
jgi:hypothetical protein